MDTQIASAVKVFEEVEKIRRGCEAKLTHLARNRRCLSCDKDWMPKAYEPCPECQSKNTRLMKQRRKCLYCDHIWQPSALGVCPWCGSSVSEENPKIDQYMRNIVIPRLRSEEDFYEKEMNKMVWDHASWLWAKQAKGAGATSIARIIGKADIHRLNTVSEMWAHCGFGLEADGTRQRKRKGTPINYDAQLQSNCVMLGESLMKAGVRKRCVNCHITYSKNTAKCSDCGQVYSKPAKCCPKCESIKAEIGKCPACGEKETEDYAITGYGQYYLKQKEIHSSLPPAHCHNRAFRHMIKLFLSHLWQTWREAEGLPAPPPYVFEILQHPHGHLISPWEMVKQPIKIR